MGLGTIWGSWHLEFLSTRLQAIEQFEPVKSGFPEFVLWTTRIDMTRCSLS